jgi:putative membrane protein (TIGR04086 family)
MNILFRGSSSCEGFRFSSVIKGLISAFILAIILSILVSLLLHLTSISESLLNNFSTFIFFISILFGSIIGAYSAGCKGLLHALSVSILFLLLILLLGVIGITGHTHIFARIGFALLAGILGGFIGIGLSTK